MTVRLDGDDYYDLLGIDASAGVAELRRAWRRLAVRWHPDRAGPRATVIFQLLSEAYTVLSDPAARAAYDRRRRPAAPRPNAPAVMLGRLSGPLASLIACGVARRLDGELIELLVEKAEAARGGMVAIPMRVLVRCSCTAAGATACPRCRGTGAVDELYSAWLAVPPGVADGTIIEPSAQLPGVLRPVTFRVRYRERR
jgi:DnaJ-class molecular chaperone